MQTIPATYKQAGHQMQFRKRLGMVALYKASADDYWEVHIVRVEKARRIFDKEYPEREALAGSSDFGAYAWACNSEDRAETRFRAAIAILAATSPPQGPLDDSH